MEGEDTFFIQNQAIEDEYHNAKVHLDSLIVPNEENLDNTFFNQNGNLNSTGNSDGGTGSGGSRMHRSHLPDIKFQPFDGAYDNCAYKTDWQRKTWFNWQIVLFKSIVERWTIAVNQTPTHDRGRVWKCMEITKRELRSAPTHRKFTIQIIFWHGQNEYRE